MTDESRRVLGRSEDQPRTSDDVEGGIDETTSLLHPEPVRPTSVNRLEAGANQGPLLDPDDPRVTPLNVRGVQIVRGILLVLLGLSVLWLIVLLVDTFVRLPVVDTRGSGFLQFDLAVLTIATLVTSLLFFLIPAQPDRVVSYVTASMLFVDTILVLAVPTLRHRNGTLEGALAMFVTLAIFVGCAVSDYYVQKAKVHEEVRLTGRPETRHTLREWFEMSIAVIIRITILALVTLLSINLLITIYDSVRLPAPGKLVPVHVDKSKFDVHLYCTHHRDVAPSRPRFNEPEVSDLTILVEGDTVTKEFAGWVLDLYETNKVPRVCYWDRPGLGFSDSAPNPLSASAVAEVLYEALKKTSDPETPFENSTFTLVSHGVGGIYSRVFASKYSHQVHSLMLVDSLHEEFFYRQATMWAGFKYWLRGVLSPLGLYNIEGVLLGQGPKQRRYGSTQKQQPGYLKAQLQQQLVARRQTKIDIIESNASINPDLPVLVVSSVKSIRNDGEWSDKQRQLTKLTDNNVAWEILSGTHDLWKEPASYRKLQQLLLDLLEYT